MENATKIIADDLSKMLGDLSDMFADLENALAREVEVHGENADMELTTAVAHWAEKLHSEGILGKWAFKSAQNLLAQAGWDI